MPALLWMLNAWKSVVRFCVECCRALDDEPSEEQQTWNARQHAWLDYLKS